MKQLLSQAFSLVKKLIGLLAIILIIMIGGYVVIHSLIEAIIYITMFLGGCIFLFFGFYMLKGVKLK